MPTNTNLVRKSNQLDKLMSEVDTRMAVSKDEDGNVNSEIFRIRNPEIELSMGDWLKARNIEAEELQKEIDDYKKSGEALDGLEALQTAGKQRGNFAPQPQPGTKRLSLAQEFFKTEGWEAFKAGKTKVVTEDIKFDLKNLFEQEAAGANAYQYNPMPIGDYVTLPRTEVTLLNLIPQIPTGPAAAVEYDRERTHLSGARSIAQGVAYTQSQYRIDKQNAKVAKVGTYIQVSEEIMEDMPELQARMNGSLMEDVSLRIQDELIGGTTLANPGEYITGSVFTGDIRGFLDLTNADDDVNVMDGNAAANTGEYLNPVTLLEQAAETIFRLGRANADAILMNSQDWTLIKTLQATTGAFILRGANAPLWMPAQRAIDEWPVVLCNSLAKGTVIVGAFGQHCTIRDRQSVQVRIMEAQAVDTSGTTGVTVPAGLYNIYADARLAFYARRGSAFTQITNFAVPKP